MAGRQVHVGRLDPNFNVACIRTFFLPYLLSYSIIWIPEKQLSALTRREPARIGRLTLFLAPIMASDTTDDFKGDFTDPWLPIVLSLGMSLA